MKEHRINPPHRISYQYRTSQIIEQLDHIFSRCTGKSADSARELFSTVKDELSALSWRSDLQVKALKDQLADTRRMMQEGRL